MKRTSFVVLALVAGSYGAIAHAQEIQVNRQNRTVAVSAAASMSALAEVAVVSLGYICYGKTHDEAYARNVASADKILKAMLGAGVAKASIQTDAMRLTEVSGVQPTWSLAEVENRHFKATQSWEIRLAAPSAQKVVDLAVKAGANRVLGVTWEVEDPDALETKAAAAALARAKSLAKGMADRLGAKLGELVYASNQQSGMRQYQKIALATQAVGAKVSTPSLELYPQKVRRTATVYAVFALQ